MQIPTKMFANAEASEATPAASLQSNRRPQSRGPRRVYRSERIAVQADWPTRKNKRSALMEKRSGNTGFKSRLD